MTTLGWMAIVGLACFALGWILCDLATVEKKVILNVRKQKVKGTGNTLDAVIDVDIEEKKERKGLFYKWKQRRLQKKNEHVK